MITEAIPTTGAPVFASLKDALKSRLRLSVQKRLQIFVLLCSGASCRRFAVAHRWLRKDGIYLDGAWFCSPGCFEAAALRVLAPSARGERHTMPRLPRMPFRLVLVRDGLLAEAELERAQAHAEQTGIPLAQALVALGCATHAQVAAALAAESGCAFYTLAPQPLAPELLLPRVLADRFNAATVHGSADRIVVGFVSRVDRGLLALVERITGRRAEGCFITAAHREAQLATQAAGPGQPGLDRAPAAGERPVSRPQAARTILERALQSGAEQVRVARSGDIVWARFWTGEAACEDCLVEMDESAAVPSLRRVGRRDEKKLHAL